MLLIDAVYIHESGGRVLLEYLLSNLKKDGCDFHVLLDKRLETSASEVLTSIECSFLDGSETARKKYYKKLPLQVSTVFCFANVPPPIKINDRKVFIFFQNALIVSGFNEVNGYSIFQKFKFHLKRVYIKSKICKHYKWVVQTRSMKDRVIKYLGLDEVDLNIIPFFESNQHIVHPLNKDYSEFLYVADGVPQKNHSRLFDAWEILGEKYNTFYQLNLTLPNKYRHLTNRIEKLKSSGFKITNYGVCGVDELKQIYDRSGYLIFPSLAESFVLPLIEASLEGCGILASDLSFVKDVVAPLYVFDPSSANDIAQTVLKANGTGIKNEVFVKDEISVLIKLLNV
jgi:hypothetical protein